MCVSERKNGRFNRQEILYVHTLFGGSARCHSAAAAEPFALTSVTVLVLLQLARLPNCSSAAASVLGFLAYLLGVSFKGGMQHSCRSDRGGGCYIVLRSVFSTMPCMAWPGSTGQLCRLRGHAYLSQEGGGISVDNLHFVRLHNADP